MRLKIKTEPKRILDFDIETVAQGYADPNWVPSRITTIAWSWVGSDKVEVRTILDYVFDLDDFLQYFFLGCPYLLEDFVEVYDVADMVTGHNLARFDNGVLNAELMRLQLPPLPAKMMQDTMRLPKARGFKKGQDVISDVLGIPAKKKSLNWAEWQQAYSERNWAVVKERCASDIVQHKLMRQQLLELGYLKPPSLWRP